MNYDTLERAVRVAMINTVGARLKDYNKYIITSNPQEIDTTAVEITFDRKILPLCFFDSKDVSLNVSMPTVTAISPEPLIILMWRQIPAEILLKHSKT